jgi:hypothetical protein
MGDKYNSTYMRSKAENDAMCYRIRLDAGRVHVSTAGGSSVGGDVFAPTWLKFGADPRATPTTIAGNSSR